MLDSVDIWTVLLTIGPDDNELPLTLSGPVILGRQRTGKAGVDYVDLSPFGAAEAGVSRQHVRLIPEGSELMAEDLGSGNGTLLNDVRLEPQRPHRLNEGDVLTLGQLKVQVARLATPSGMAEDTQTPPAEKSVSVTRAERQELTPMASLPVGNGELVLVVEDDNDVAELLSTILKRAGYQTVVSRDVLNGIRLFNQRRPSAVILDLMLPDVYGLEFCRYVRRDVQYNKTPIVVVSAVGAADTAQTVLQAGADKFLEKPVSARELIQTIGSLISQRQTGIDPMSTKVLASHSPFQNIPPEHRHDTVVLFIAGHGEMPLTVSLRQPVTFGRTPGASPGKTHIDLSRYGAADLGVSRVHMVLSQEDGKFYVEDQGSSNGTFVNGNPIPPHTPTTFNSGSEIRLGQLRLFAYFLADNTPSR